MAKRTKTWGSRNPVDVLLKVGNGTPYKIYSSIRSSDYGYLLGEDLAGFHKMKRSGVLLPLTYFRKLSENGSQTGTYYAAQSGGTTYTYTAGFFSSCWQSDASLEASLSGLDASYFVQAAAAKIYASGWDALTFIAELKETANMFRNTALRFSRTLRKIRSAQTVGHLAKRAKRGGIKTAKSLDDLWLEGRYGWRTLAYDVQDIIKAISRIDDKRKRFRESVGTTFTDSVSWPQTVSGGMTVVLSRVTEYEFGLRGTAVADIEPPKVAFNPVITAWELTKLSFVVDWFVNVGQWLESMSYLALATQHYEAQGLYVKATTTGTVESVSFLSGWSGYCTWTGSWVQELYERVPTSVSFNPLQQVRLDLWKGLDILSLVGQYLQRRLK